jgi:hypothetical protein
MSGGLFAGREWALFLSVHLLPLLPLYTEALELIAPRSRPAQHSTAPHCTALGSRAQLHLRNTLSSALPATSGSKLITDWPPFAHPSMRRHLHPSGASSNPPAVAIRPHRQIAPGSARAWQSPSSKLALNMPKLQPISPVNRAVLHTTPIASLRAPSQRASQLDGTGA